MKKIEFITKADDGVIRIPKKYAKNLTNKLRVVIHCEKDTTTKQKKIKTATGLINVVSMSPKNRPKKVEFTALSISTKGFKFNRDEANERY